VKLIPYGVILLLVASLVFQTNQLKHSREQLTNERAQRGEVAKLLGAEDNWVSIRTHARDLQQSNTNMVTALDSISKETLAAKQRADAADEALRREQAENAKRFAAASATIARLEKQKSTGNAAQDDNIIEELSKLPWSGWHSTPSAVPAGWLQPENRFDYTHMTVPLIYSQRPVRLVLYKSPVELEIAFAKQNPGVSFPGMRVAAYSDIDSPDGVCVIHVVDPKVVWNTSARTVLGHELAHCFYGYWHEDASK
jgi:hypothetical protein